MNENLASTVLHILIYCMQFNLVTIYLINPLIRVAMTASDAVKYDFGELNMIEKKNQIWDMIDDDYAMCTAWLWNAVMEYKTSFASASALPVLSTITVPT